MAHIRNFYNFREYINIGEDFRIRGFVKADNARIQPEFGFFIRQGQDIVFVIGSPAGPVIGHRGQIHAVSKDAEIVLVERNGGRMLEVRQGSATFRIPAPHSNFVDPNDDDEEISDFFVWIQRRLSMPHVREQFITR
jgi:hypothetical protein